MNENLTVGGTKFTIELRIDLEIMQIFAEWKAVFSLCKKEFLSKNKWKWKITPNRTSQQHVENKLAMIDLN